MISMPRNRPVVGPDGQPAGNGLKQQLQQGVKNHYAHSKTLAEGLVHCLGLN